MIEDSRRANATTCHHEIIILAHPPHSLHNLPLVIGNNLDPLQRNAQ